MDFVNLKLKIAPFPTLFSERLELVPLSQNDSAALFELRSDPQVMEFIDRPLMVSEVEVSAFIEKITNGVNQGKWIYWKIQLRGSSELLGTICLWMFNEDGDSCDIGYELRKTAWGKGYMKEAVKAVCEYGFEVLGLKKLVAFTAKNNYASTRLLLKSGFDLNGKEGLNLIYQKVH